MDDDWRQGGLDELGGVVDGVRVQHHQLQGPRQLEDPLDFALYFGWGRKAEQLRPQHCLH